MSLLAKADGSRFRGWISFLVKVNIVRSPSTVLSIVTVQVLSTMQLYSSKRRFLLVSTLTLYTFLFTGLSLQNGTMS